jgi:Arc/MetJ family transcription regulator
MPTIQSFEGVNISSPAASDQFIIIISRRPAHPYRLRRWRERFALPGSGQGAGILSPLPGGPAHGPLPLDAKSELWRTIHMKRTNLVLNGDLLEETLRLSGERTYSRAVEAAMQDFVRRVKARRILELAGSGLWEGDLATMRGDRPKYGRKDRRVPR